MLQRHAHWLMALGFSGSLLFACSDNADTGGNTAGTGNTSGTAGTAAQGGSAGSSGSGTAGSTAGTPSSGGSGGAAGGSGGAAGGSGGAAGGSGGATGGSGGAAGAATGGGGSGGTAPSGPTAVANIMGVGPENGHVTGTATFTQGATMTKLVLTITECPDGPHVSHLHQTKDCGNNGNAAGNHWVPNGENLGNYTCANGAATLTVEKPTSTWTVGGDEETDVTLHAFMVHEGSDPSPGGRVGCGVVNEQ